MVKPTNKSSPMMKRGMTLVEILVALGIFSIIMISVTAFQKDVFTFNTTLFNTILGQQEARQALKTMIKEVRMASLSATGSYPLSEVATSSLTFYTDIDGDTIKDQIRYYLATSTKTLNRNILKPTGNPLAYTGTGTTSILAYNIVNASTTPLFTYYDSNYAGTTTPLTEPVNVLSVRLVKITVLIDKDQNRSPNTLTITSQTSIRSLKDNL